MGKNDNLRCKSPGRTLITGASSGIGEALARHFASRGHELVLTARRRDRLETLADELRARVNVTVIPADLAADQGVDSLITELDRADLAIDILVNNAGVASSETFQAMGEDTVDRLLSVNVLSLTRLTKCILPGMRARGFGRILNVASVASFQPVPSLGLYAASKAFVLSLTESLAEELRGSGVTVTALCPGLTKTEMVEDIHGALQVPAFMMASAEAVAREGYAALMSGEVVRVPGLANVAAITWAKFQPRWLVRNLGGLAARLTA